MGMQHNNNTDLHVQREKKGMRYWREDTYKNEGLRANKVRDMRTKLRHALFVQKIEGQAVIEKRERRGLQRVERQRARGGGEDKSTRHKETYWIDRPTGEREDDEEGEGKDEDGMNSGKYPI